MRKEYKIMFYTKTIIHKYVYVYYNIQYINMFLYILLIHITNINLIIIV